MISTTKWEWTGVIVVVGVGLWRVNGWLSECSRRGGLAVEAEKTEEREGLGLPGWRASLGLRLTGGLAGPCEMAVRLLGGLVEREVRGEVVTRGERRRARVREKKSGQAVRGEKKKRGGGR